MDPKQAALAVLRKIATPEVRILAEALVEAGTYRWVWDPAAAGVAGLEEVGSRRYADLGGKAAMIVWTEPGREDFDYDPTIIDV
jgi:hypothetical protein